MNKTFQVFKNLNTPQLIIDATIMKVENLLKESFEDYVSYDNGTFTISHGSTQVMIIIRPYTATEAAVEFVATVAVGSKINDGLMKYLLQANNEIHFGAFGLMFDDTVTFSHTISGNSINRDEFNTSLLAVAAISDFYDDIIVEMAGGKRAKDIIDLEAE